MPKDRRKRRPPKRSLALPDLEQTKSAVLNSLTQKAASEHTIMRLMSSSTVVLGTATCLQSHRCAPIPRLPRAATPCSDNHNLRLAAVRRVAYEAADSGIRRVKGVRRIGVRLGNLKVIHSATRSPSVQPLPQWVAPMATICQSGFFLPGFSSPRSLAVITDPFELSRPALK